MGPTKKKVPGGTGGSGRQETKNFIKIILTFHHGFGNLGTEERGKQCLT
jgi:hypothetical protein